MTPAILERLQAVGTWARRLFGRGARRVDPEIQPKIVEALSTYLGGNHDLTQLRTLAGKHPEVFQDTILQYQTIVAGRRVELCDLAIEMGYLQAWCHETHAPNVTKRRKAFAQIAAMAHYEPVRRLVGNIPYRAFQDPDEQIRLEAARILLATGEPVDIVQVFEGVILETAGIRETIGGELRRHAILLCESVIPRALRCLNPRGVLQLLVSWECGLPLPDMQTLAAHSDPAVRLEAMRLLPFLPRTAENRAAALSGLADENRDVSAAAATTARRLGIPNPNAEVSDAPDDWLHAIGSPRPSLENT